MFSADHTPHSQCTHAHARTGASVGTKATSARAAKAAASGNKSKAAAKKPKKATALGSRRSARRRIDDDDEEDEEDDEDADEEAEDADGDDDMGASSSSSSSAVGGPAFWLSFAACAGTHALLGAARRLLACVSLARHPEALPTLVEAAAACARAPSDLCDAGLEAEAGSSSSFSSSSSSAASSSSSSSTSMADFATTAACVHAIREAAFDALALCAQPLQDDLSSSSSSSAAASSSASNGAGAQVPLVLRALLPVAMGHLAAASSHAAGGLRGHCGSLLPPVASAPR